MIEVEINNDNFRIPAGRPADIVLILKNRGNKKEKVNFKIISELNMKNEELEWVLSIMGATKEKEDILVTKEENRIVEYPIEVGKGKNKEIYVTITTPKASEIGDSGTFKFEIANEESWSREVQVTLEAAIVAIKTTIGQEIKVAREIGIKSQMRGWKEIFAVLAPSNLRGYVLVETSRPDKILSLIRGIKGAKGVVRGEMKMKDIRHYLTPTPKITTISVGDIVELVEGPFKGEHARVIQIDETKNEIKVELFEAMVPIPITVKAEAVRIIERGE